MPDLESKKIWEKENIQKITIKLNRKKDADILDRLSYEKSIQGGIKRLIRKAMFYESDP
jgi:hypothetical protein